MLEESRLRYERVRGVPHIRDPGNSRKRFTGAWRTFMPVWDLKKCIKCRVMLAQSSQKPLIRKVHATSTGRTLIRHCFGKQYTEIPGIT